MNFAVQKSSSTGQCKGDGRRQWYLGIPVTSAALTLPVFFVAADSHGGGIWFLGLLLVMALLFLLPIKIRKPYLAGKIEIVFTEVVEFVILFIELTMEV